MGEMYNEHDIVQNIAKALGIDKPSGISESNSKFAMKCEKAIKELQNKARLTYILDAMIDMLNKAKEMTADEQ